MFTFGDTKNDILLTEGIMDNVLNTAGNAVGVDTDKFRKAWNDAADPNIHPNKVSDSEVTHRRMKLMNKAGNTAVNKIDKTTSDISKLTDNRSLVARAKNSIMMFSCYISQSTPVNVAQIESELFARVYTSLVQSVLSQNQILDESEAHNMSFLKNYHTNLREAVDVFVNQFYEPIDNIDEMICESVFLEQKITNNLSVTFSAIPRNNEIINMESAIFVQDPIIGFESLYAEAEEIQSENKDNFYTLSDNDFRDMAMNQLNMTSSDRKLADMSEIDLINRYGDYDSRSGKNVPNGSEYSDAIDARNDLNNQIDNKIADIKDAIKSGEDKNYSMYKYVNGRFARCDRSATVKNISKRVDAPIILRDHDIKKINAMAPYTIKAQFKLRDNKGNITGEVEYVIGVKCILHLIRTEDLVDDLPELVTGKIKKLQKVRYKTGEITFFDYLFNKKGLKSDAAKRINHNKRWINNLKRLSEYRQAHGGFLKKSIEDITSGHVPIPNGTLILTQSDVSTLTSTTGIDLSESSNAIKLAKNLFLMAVVIIDSSAGTMRVLFPDESSSWNVYSLSSIEADLAKTDNNKLMQELNRVVNTR